MSRGTGEVVRDMVDSSKVLHEREIAQIDQLRMVEILEPNSEGKEALYLEMGSS